MRGFGLALALGAVLAAAAPVAAQDPIPERRAVYLDNADLPGGDIGSLFDTSVEACERACLSNGRCVALTYNSRNGSCFLKSDPGAPAFYQGAFSARVVTADPAARARAVTRAAELAFLQPWDIGAARLQASALGGLHMAGDIPVADHLAQAAAAGDPGTAAGHMGAAVTLTDDAGHWAEYARLLAAQADRDRDARDGLLQRAFAALVNAYLRADAPAQRHGILADLGAVLEQQGRGRDTVQALRLAQALQPRDDTAAALDAAIGKYGFRILEHEVQSDLARPRLCATFSEDLARAGVDYATFVQLPEPGLVVERAGDRQLCIEGLAHGARYAVTFRPGLPAADGQEMVRPVTITSYVRDRTPAVRFPGRAYVLPRGADAAIPVETVNTDALDLALFGVSDRNILRAIQGDFFGAPMAGWQEGDFAGRIGAELWRGTATVGMEVNRDMTTRLPLQQALAGLPAGIYALRAAVPGKDSWAVPPGWQWFVVSDLGITTLSGTDGLHVVLRSLGTAGPRAGVTVELLSRANAVLAAAVTDDLGHARFDAGLVRGTGGQAPAMVVARDGDADLAFLSLTDPEFDLSDRGVSGREAAPPVDVFLTTERGAYRAGETVFATALARDAQARAIAGLPLTAVWRRPDGVEYARAVVNDRGGGYVLSQPIAGNAPRGPWRLDLLADADAPPLASRTFLVEDFLPERIDFALTLPDAPLRLGDAPDLAVDARYLFGAPGAGLRIEGEVLLVASRGLPQWPGYAFGRQDEPFQTRYQPLGGGQTDETGQALLSAPLPEAEDPGQPLEARFVLRVAEGSGRPVERRITRALTPSAPMIGIRPLFADVVPEGSDARLALIAVDADAAATPMAVEWELTRIETRYQWYQDYGNWYWEPVTTRSRVAEGRADLGTAPLEVGAPVTWGQYELAVTQIGGPARSSTTFWAGWYAPADVTSTPDTLEMSLDKPAYRTGDTATLRVVPRAAGTALVSVLSNRLVSMQAVEVVAGENLIPLPVTDDWGAGVYVTVSALRPMDVAAGRNPARALGVAHAAVDPGDRQLRAVVEVAAESPPRAPLDVAVRVDGVAPGDTAHVTIAAVDLGILNLTAFAPPDPSAHYFGQRRLGVGIRDIYGRLIDGLNGAEGQVRSGGDAGAQARLQAPPPTEELVAYFTGPVQVGADGLARASFDLPAFNGTVRVMAVAWSDRGVGQASADVLVRDPVVVTASLPRFLSPGDESRLLLEIVHATGPAGRMGLDVTAQGLTLGAVPSGLDLPPQGKAVVTVPLTAQSTGIHTIDVALTTPEGRQLTKRLSIPVQVNDPEIARISRFDLAPGQSFTFDANAFAGIDPGTGMATLAIGPIARLNAPGLLASLDRYPYGCTEQLAARALPLLYLDQLAQAMRLDEGDTIRARVAQAIGEILLNQASDGAFGLWSAGSGDFWLDAFVTDVLSRARAQGFDVPAAAFRMALDNLRNQVNYAPDFDRGGEALAYALMVLAREGAAAIGDLRYYADVKADAFATPLAQAQLGAALAAYGDQMRADAMFRRAGAAIAAATAPEGQLFRADYGTQDRDAAGVLTLAVEAGSQAVDRESLADRLARRAGPMSTQEATWTLMAAHALLDAPGAEGITIDGTAPQGPLVRVLHAQAAPLVVANSGTRATTLTVTAYGVPTDPEPPGGNGYAITRSYYTLDGAPVSLDAPIPVGTRLAVVLEVTPFNRGEARLMVADPLPAGFEIDNPNLISGGTAQALADLGLDSETRHAEFRQDRFLAAVDRADTLSFRLGYVVRAVSPGTFHHPAASVEDMYRPDYRARSATGRITIAD